MDEGKENVMFIICPLKVTGVFFSFLPPLVAHTTGKMRDEV